MEKQIQVLLVLLVATIVSGIVIVIILMPIDERPPCQTAAIDNFNLYKENSQILANPDTTAEEYEKFEKEFLKRDQASKDLFKVNNCESTQLQWYTPEFQKEMQALLDEGF